ncbi:Hypothetical protein CAP_7674 [Chondromyces apiculatus DSM 436]|uniref:HTH merR-type domain-containing protein n=1 Tax=Chondromyces apiculatus DSM 436 TaxID=1192034 RepID=A0A017T010_9BACT|nr:Hypothetical protein CAP_7674 [Chondromyces apiculatus DSM 436]
MLSVAEVASFCGVNPQTVRRWARRGHLPKAGESPSGRAHFAPAQVARFLTRHGYPLPEALKGAEPTSAEGAPETEPSRSAAA